VADWMPLHRTAALLSTCCQYRWGRPSNLHKLISAIELQSIWHQTVQSFSIPHMLYHVLFADTFWLLLWPSGCYTRIWTIHNYTLFVFLYNTLLIFLYDTLMMVAEEAKTCQRIIYDKTYLIYVHLLVYYIV